MESLVTEKKLGQRERVSSPGRKPYFRKRCLTFEYSALVMMQLSLAGDRGYQSNYIGDHCEETYWQHWRTVGTWAVLQSTLAPK
jgi:hypothetical protein